MVSIAGRGPRGEWLSIGGPVAALRPQTVAKSRVAMPGTGRARPTRSTDTPGLCTVGHCATALGPDRPDWSRLG
ncbi:hypothetical protein LC55x_5720 [Lysobacter capsici]|nr:hypothetical protein LC55x_5720 [Lysobacter capsici]